MLTASSGYSIRAFGLQQRGQMLHERDARTDLPVFGKYQTRFAQLRSLVVLPHFVSWPVTLDQDVVSVEWALISI